MLGSSSDGCDDAGVPGSAAIMRPPAKRFPQGFGNPFAPLCRSAPGSFQIHFTVWRLVSIGPAPYTCEEALQRLDDFLDRELAREEARLVEAHFAVCVACLSKYRF